MMIDVHRCLEEVQQFNCRRVSYWLKVSDTLSYMNYSVVDDTLSYGNSSGKFCQQDMIDVYISGLTGGREGGVSSP